MVGGGGVSVCGRVLAQSQPSVDPLQACQHQTAAMPHNAWRRWWSRNLRPLPVFIAIVVVMLFPISALAGGWSY